MKKLPKILGILNMTTDSFSDGGQYVHACDAISHGESMWQEGASIIDIGPASSHPDAKEVSADLELQRLQSILPALTKKNISISVDTPKSQTQLWLLEQEKYKISWLNDIHGFQNESVIDKLSGHDCGLFVMHSIHANSHSVGSDIWESILRFFEERLSVLIKAGISKERLVLDPGMGLFLGRGIDESLQVLSQLHRLKQNFELPILISVSRKSFLRQVTQRGVTDCDSITLAAELFATNLGVDYIRTHNVRKLYEALHLYEMLADY